MNTRDLVPIVSGLFRGGRGRTTRIAVEQEYLVADAVTGGAVPIERIGRAARIAAAAPYLGFEPGGQVELSLPCMPDPATVTRTLRGLTDDLRRRLAAAGIGIHALPVDSRGTGRIPLQLTTPRYVAMQRHFDTIGPAGRRMMRCTASTQVCLDWWPGRDGAEQWRVLNLAAPFLAAAFARSAGPDGRLTTWLAVDPARTGFDDRVLYGDDPIASYASFAAGAVAFAAGGTADHLTTLFPPVRPRTSYLEVRFLDVQEPAAIGPVVRALAELLYNDDRRRSTLQALEPECRRLGEHWRAAAAGDPATADRGRELLPASDWDLVA